MGRRTEFFLTATCEVITYLITCRWFLRALRLNITPQILSVRILLHSLACHIPYPSHPFFKSFCRTFMRIFSTPLRATFPTHLILCSSLSAETSCVSSPLPCVPHSLPISFFLQVFLPNLHAYPPHSRACHISYPSHSFFKSFCRTFMRILSTPVRAAVHAHLILSSSCSTETLYVFFSIPVRATFQAHLIFSSSFSAEPLCVLHSRACHVPYPSHPFFKFFYRNPVRIVLYSRACHIPFQSHPFFEFFFAEPLCLSLSNSVPVILHTHLIFLGFIILIISDEYEKSLGP